MKRYLFGLALLSCSTFVPADYAHGAVSEAVRMAARRDLAEAKLKLRHYWLVEYPRQRRELNDAIELTELEVRNLKAQLRSYGTFTRFSTGQPFMLTIQRVRMCLKEAELRLSDLQAERNALVRFHSDDFRLLAINVQEARLRVAEFEQDAEAELIPAPIE